MNEMMGGGMAWRIGLLGLLPMLPSKWGGAETQRLLATVVVGGWNAYCRLD
jgi:Cu/Ag efflux pump CusA